MSLLDRLLPAAAACTTGVMLGASFVATRFVLDQAGPAALAFLRYFIALACLAGVALFLRRVRIAPRHALPIAGLGVLQFGVFHLAFNAGLEHIPASRAAVIFSLVSFLTLGLSALRGYETLSLPKAGGALLAIAGVALALGVREAPAGEAGIPWLGELLVFSAVCCGASWNAFSRPYLQLYPPLPVTLLAMLAGVCFSFPFAAAEGLFADLAALTLGGWGVVLFLAVPAGAFSFFIFNWALQQTTPARTAVFLPLSPIAATFFGAVLLSEPITRTFLVGLVLVVSGIWLANWQRRGSKPG